MNAVTRAPMMIAAKKPRMGLHAPSTPTIGPPCMTTSCTPNMPASTAATAPPTTGRVSCGERDGTLGDAEQTHEESGNTGVTLLLGE